MGKTMPKVARGVIQDAKFQPGSLVVVSGREDEGPFRVVHTVSFGAGKSAGRNVKCYRESGGKFEWISEGSMKMKGATK